MSHPPTRPADRYGDRTGRRPGAVVALLVLGAVFVGWVLWAGVGAADRDVRWSDVGYRIVDATTVEVMFSVVKDPEATAECTLEALDQRFAVVGLATVEVGPAEEQGVRSTGVVRTSEPAVTGVVDSCRIV